MNNNINDNGMQGSGLNADEIASSLAFVTQLGEQSLPKDMPQMEQPMGEEAPVEAPQEPETAPESTQEPELEERVGEVEKKLDMEEYMADMEVRLDEKLESFKEDLLKAINKE